MNYAAIINGAFTVLLVITCLVTALDMLNIKHLSDNWRTFLQKVLLAELLVVSIGTFAGVVRIDSTRGQPTDISLKPEEVPVKKDAPVIPLPPPPATLVNQNSVELMSVYNDGGKEVRDCISPPPGYVLDRSLPDPVTRQARVTLGKRQPTVETRIEGENVCYRIWTKHGAFFDQWRSLVSVDFTIHYRLAGT